MPPFDLRWLRPIGLVGALIAIVGSVTTEIAARRGEWGLVAIGLIVLAAGGLIVFLGRRRDSDQ